MDAPWLTSLITATPQDGFERALVLSRRGVGYSRPDGEQELRGPSPRSADRLVVPAQAVAIHFQTIAAANHHWCD